MQSSRQFVKSVRKQILITPGKKKKQKKIKNYTEIKEEMIITRNTN